MAKIDSNWACIYWGHSVIVLRERFGTKFNNCFVLDRSLDFLPLSHPDMFPIDVHFSDTFPDPDPLIGSNA
jgi:hypothetical protein